jgi:hypothetical protein
MLKRSKRRKKNLKKEKIPSSQDTWRLLSQFPRLESPDMGEVVGYNYTLL